MPKKSNIVELTQEVEAPAAPEISSCPFHGKACETSVLLSFQKKAAYYQVGADCGARGPEDEDRVKAIRGWNKRC